MINRAIVKFTPEMLVNLCRGKYEVVDNPVPEGSRIVDCGYDDGDGYFFIVVQGENIPGAIEGGLYIELRPVIRKISE